MASQGPAEEVQTWKHTNPQVKLCYTDGFWWTSVP